MKKINRDQLNQRVSIYLSTLSEGGAERVLLNLAVGFVQRGFPVDFVLAQAEGAYMPYFPKEVRLVELNKKHIRGGRSFYSFPALVAYIRRVRPAVMLTGMFNNIFAIWARQLAGVPMRLIISEHNTFSVANREPTFMNRVLMPLLLRISYPLADEIVAVSKGAADDLTVSAGIQREKIRVIYNPVITPELVRKAQEPLDHPWFMPEEPPVILAVGRITPQKDYSLLIRAFAQVRQSMPVRLLILGDGEERAAMTELVSQLGLQDCVSMPGFVENPYAFMARAGVFVLSSRWEGLPTVLVEALYCGAPLVSTDCPSGPREILQDGAYGRLVPMGDAEKLAEAILAALREEHRVPPPQSWHPFESSTVLDHYARLFWGEL